MSYYTIGIDFNDILFSINYKTPLRIEVMPKKLTEMRYSSAGYYSAENKRVFVFFRLSGIMFGK